MRSSAEFSALTKAKGRLQHLEQNRQQQRASRKPSAPLFPSPDSAEIVALKAKLTEVEGERRSDRESVEQAAGDHVVRGTRFNFKRRSTDARDQSSQRLSEWLQACHEELGQALVVGNETRVMELSSQLSDGAAKLSELMRVMVLWSHGRGQDSHDVERSWGASGRSHTSRSKEGFLECSFLSEESSTNCV